MPPASSPLILGLATQDNRSLYRPGDTIVGFVHRKSRLVTPHATIKISLHGTAQVWRDALNLGEGSSDNAPFSLLDDLKCSQILHDGPLHIAPGLTEAQQWPFAMTIPTHVNNPRWGTHQDMLLSLQSGRYGDRRLPTSTHGHSGQGKLNVKYTLRAELQTFNEKEAKTYDATLPLGIASLSLDTNSAKLQWHDVFRSVNSFRLVPGQENTAPSTSHRMKNFFVNPTDPTFWFHLEVQTPTLAYINDPSPIPFLVRAVPDWQKSHKTMLQVAPRVKLSGFKLDLGGFCEVKCEGRDGRPPGRSYLGKENVIEWQDRAVEIPCGEKCDFVDIGEAINLRIDYGGQYFEAIPGYVAPHLAKPGPDIFHRLYWKVCVEIAGKEVECRKDQWLGVLPLGDKGDAAPSLPPPFLEDSKTETWIRPPDEPDAPPSFQEVQMEDMKVALDRAMEDGKQDGKQDGKSED